MGEKLKKEDGGKAADVTHYRSLIGNLLYLTTTRPDLMYAASLLSRFMQSLSHFHLGATKRVLRYVQGTTNLGLSFQKNHALNLVGYCDSDLGGSLDDMKSTSGYCFSFGLAIFSWLSKKQQSVAQSSAEAEYISASVATSQAIWLRRILADLGHHQGTVLYYNNKSAIAMAKNPIHHSRTRHITLKHHFIRQTIEDREIQLEFCRSEEQLSDIFTKALPRERFEQL
ncbi:secreted RxLR effector protein 161-like [Curcuma longa]|uniref:secreted RxLR effector protein 161-like n=1 Tax=Curcuma longa TaxID=136217 RepID=UPI003D9E0AF0